MAGLIGACIVLAILCMILIVQKIYLAYRIRKLAEQVDGFNSGTTDILDVALQEDKLAQLHNGIADLQQSLIRAKQLNSEECIRTSQLTADISHQLKTPLTTLRLYTELDRAWAALWPCTAQSTITGGFPRRPACPPPWASACPR